MSQQLGETLVTDFADTLVEGLIKAGAEDVLKSIGLAFPTSTIKKTVTNN